MSAFQTVRIVRDASGIVRGRIFSFKRKGETILKAQAYGRFASLYSGPEWERTHYTDADLMACDLACCITGHHGRVGTYAFRALIDAQPTAEYR